MKQIKYAKTKLGRVSFEYSENMSDRGDGKLWTQDRVDAYLNNTKVGYLKIDYIKQDNFFKILPNKEAFNKYFGEMGHVYSEKHLTEQYKDFYYHWVDCPLVDYINVQPSVQRHGIGYVLYIAGALWMADKKMCLHAASVQSDEAQLSWGKMKKVGLPVKTYKNSAGKERICLDYRGERGFK